MTMQIDGYTLVYSPAASEITILIPKDADISRSSLENVLDVVKELCEREIKMGKWEQENIVLTSYPPQYQWHCSECGEIKRGFDSGILTNYCPNCGAKMDEEEK